MIAGSVAAAMGDVMWLIQPISGVGLHKS